MVLAGAGASVGELTIHCLNVGQGDCTLIESPTGGTFLFDGGNNSDGDQIVVPYLQMLGLQALDYVCASHYHADHIGGLDEVVNHFGVDSIRVAALDRGWSYGTVSYDDYEDAVVSKRATIYDGQVVDLGGGVTVTCVAVNGNGVLSPPFDDQYSENDLSVALVVRYLDFDFFVAGDLSGVNTSFYEDIETSVAPEVGPVEVYRVDHHGSIANSNANLVSTLLPRVSIISAGDGNPYGHPTQTVINRLIFYGSYIYQTELGSGGTIPPGDGEVVDGHVVIDVDSTMYVINGTDIYDMGTATTPISVVNEDDAIGRPVLYGEAVVIEGIVTVGTGTFSSIDNDIFVQDVTGGVHVLDRNSMTPVVSVGDRVNISGIVDQSTGLTKLSSPLITLEAAGIGEPEPVLVQTADIDSAGETLEGLFVKVEACSITGGTWPGEGWEGTLTIDDGSGECTLLIDPDTNIDGSEEPTGTMEIVGVVTQYDLSSPYHSSYRLVPRSSPFAIPRPEGVSQPCEGQTERDPGRAGNRCFQAIGCLQYRGTQGCRGAHRSR
jgi:beta-lactamase superfamily II metal-dependent hydrolase